MGVYDIVGGIQIKCTKNPKMKTYGLGSEIDLPDGCYIGYEGFFLIRSKKVIFIGLDIFDKWGNLINKAEILDKNNEIAKQVKAYVELHESGEGKKE